jgi:hypothetical protein
VEAGHQLAEDKKSGAFELLFSTPLSVRDILRGQWLALRRQFLKPLAVAVIVELILMVSVRHREGAAQGRCLWLAAILMLPADAITLVWVAMSAALTAKSHGRATVKTAASILLLPWLLFGAVELATHLWIFPFSSNPWEPDWTYDLGWWFGLGIFVDVLFLLRARRQLQTSFRQIVLEPFAPRPRFAWLRGWRTGSLERNTHRRLKLRRMAVAAAALLAVGAGVVLYIIRAFHVDLPKPVIVSISQSNNPVRVLGGGQGFLFILPDGTLWRWVKLDWGQPAIISQPSQVGSDRDWVQASVSLNNAVGLRSDGTLWAWAVDHGEPRQVGSDHDWAEASAGAGFSIARRRDGTLWAWGDNHRYQLGNGPGPNRSDVAQVGTNHDWKAIGTTKSTAHVLALRANGTLWTWGLVDYFTNGTRVHTTNAFPIQVCRESNWIGFNDGLQHSVRNQDGESWSFSPSPVFRARTCPLRRLALCYLPTPPRPRLAFSSQPIGAMRCMKRGPMERCGRHPCPCHRSASACGLTGFRCGAATTGP